MSKDRGILRAGATVLLMMAFSQASHASEPHRAASAVQQVEAPSAVSMGDPVGSFAPMLARVIPAVVTLRVVSETSVPLEIKPDAAPAGEPPRKIQSRSGGSGVIVDPASGHILTNNHVIDGAIRIEVVLADGRWMLGKLVGRDIGTDLAVVEVAERGLTGIAVGNSDLVRVGDVVAAIGNPFGLEGTATLGIVSATMRSEIGHEAFEDFLQIDAVINPGNSGGALVNVRGELIGINTATAGTSGNVGIGFAIPINMARTIKRELIEQGRMRRGALGLLVEDLGYERAAALMSGTNRGALVTEVVAASPAAVAGIAPGSIVIQAAGKPVRGAAELRAREATLPLGATIEVIVRKDGRDVRHDLTLAEVVLPTAQVRLADDLGAIGGLIVADIGSGNPLYGDVRGTQVMGAAEGSRAAGLGLKPGDVIVGLDDATIRRAEHLVRYGERAPMVYRLRIMRDGMPAWLRVTR